MENVGDSKGGTVPRMTHQDPSPTVCSHSLLKLLNDFLIAKSDFLIAKSNVTILMLLQNLELFIIPSLVLLIPLIIESLGPVEKWRGLRPKDMEFGRKKNFNAYNFQVPSPQQMMDCLNKYELNVCKASPSAPNVWSLTP